MVEEGRRVRRVANLNEELQKILRLLGREYENTTHDGGHAECGIRIERSNELQRLKMYRHIIP